jgi:hypothetical protein
MKQSDDRRRELRYLLLRATARVRKGEDGVPLTARIVDASRGGVRLAVEPAQTLAEGDQVMCELELPEALRKLVPARSTGTVVRVDGNVAAIRFNEEFFGQFETE